ncbi:unnamed protein product, partial [Ambrosiozyma monospora]
MGVLGISYQTLESTIAGTGNGDGFLYDNFPMVMKNQGLISKLTYSVYLNDSDSSTANVLFGAIDHEKYTGDLALMPIVNSMASYGFKEPAAIDVTLSSIKMGSQSQKSEVKFADGAAAALLDTGTTLTYVPDDVLQAIASIGGFSYSSTAKTYMVDCSLGDDFYLTFNFLGFEVAVPFSAFFLPVSGGSTTSQCGLGIYSSGDQSVTLGDNFLTSVYA